MEAPEKIYIQPSAIEQLPHQNIVYTKPLADNSIEYTHTDTFIEKACKWLREGGNGWYLSSEFGEDEINFVKFAEDFKNYMKGE